MFTKIEANVPLYLPSRKHPINAILKVDDQGYIEVQAINSEVADELLKFIGEMGSDWRVRVEFEPIPAKAERPPGL